MTRKDYINIAGAFQAVNARIRNQTPAERQLPPMERIRVCEEQLRGVRKAAVELAQFLADDNPRFDPELFLVSCGYRDRTQEELYALSHPRRDRLSPSATEMLSRHQRHEILDN